LVLLAVVLLGSVAVAASASRDSSATTAAKAPPAKWKSIVTKAKQEGKVVLYSSGNPALIAVMAANFKKKYGITVTVNRNIDSVLTAQVGQEFSSNNHTADIWVNASKGTVIAVQRQGWSVPAVGPNLWTKAYDRATFTGPGNAFLVGEAILGLGWNTSLVKGTMKGIPELTTAAFKGRFGVPQPTSASLVDWYKWLQENFGKAFLAKLAANKPKIYLSSLTMQQAVAAGELSASPFTPGTVLDLKKQGAPVNWKLSLGAKTWNAPYWASILKGAPHPNAAQLLSDYMVTKAGQQAMQHLTGTVLKGVPEAYFVAPRKQPLLTPKQVTEFQASWDKLFK
jgi:iron(III) transport system substrate-binding protein